MDLIQETLLEELDSCSPRQVLCLADGPMAGLDAYLAHHEDCVVEHVDPEVSTSDLGDLGRYDLGILCGVLEHRPAQDGAALIARLRDVHCRRLCVLWRADHRAGRTPEWTRESFLSLTLTLHRRIEQDGVCTEIYLYDIDRYNPPREWNTPEGWANPENFRRYRW